MANKHISHVKSNVTIPVTYVNKADESDIITAEAYGELSDLEKEGYEVATSEPKLPSASDIYNGELAINYAEGYERISLKNTNEDIIEFIPKTQVTKLVNKTVYGEENPSPVPTVFTTNNLVEGDNISITYNSSTNKYSVSTTGGGSSYYNLPAEEGGTDVSLVTTGDKYVWNNKQDALQNRQASQGGTDVSVVTTGEKYTWNNKQDTITFNTAYNASTNKAATMSDVNAVNEVSIGTETPSTSSTIELFVDTDESPVYIDGGNFLRGTVNVVTVSGNLSNVAPTTNLAADEQMHIIYVNSGTTTDYNVVFATTYKTPDGAQLTLKCPKGGYCEANFYSDGNNIYLRGV